MPNLIAGGDGNVHATGMPLMDALRHALGGDYQNIPSLFRDMDINGVGSVSVEEFRQVRRLCVPPLELHLPRRLSSPCHPLHQAS